MALRTQGTFVTACGVVLVVNLFDLLDSLLQQPYTLSFQACRNSHLLEWDRSKLPYCFFFFAVTNLFACSLTECPATGCRCSSGSNADHARRLCSHTEPPGPGAALLGHAHSLQHRYKSLLPKHQTKEIWSKPESFYPLTDYQLTSADITALHALASPGGLLPASVSTWQQQTVSQQPHQQQQQQQQLNLASLSNLV